MAVLRKTISQKKNSTQSWQWSYF